MRKILNFLLVILEIIFLIIFFAASLFLVTKLVIAPRLSKDAKESVDAFCNNLETFVIDIFDGETEEPAIKGMELSKMGQYEINEYTDFLVPIGFGVAKLKSEDNVTQEAIAITGNGIVATLQLMNLDSYSTNEKLVNTQDIIIGILKEKYPLYEFAPQKTKNRVTILSVETGDDSIMSISIIGLEQKTLVVSFVYSESNKESAEEYFQYINGEVLN